jgi:prepilin-type N-terminal cleavage/methylation domain-containing protein
MARKYTILKVLIQNLSKERHSNKGFTLIELIVGMVILVSIIGLAMNAFISASSDFNKDKKTIDSSQSLSAVLELIGSDIRQAGEQINESKFPAIKIEYPNPDSGSMANSSKITVRRALSTALTLCENITSTSTNTTLVVADNSLTTSTNCSTGTVVTTTLPSVITRPQILKDARAYRCKLDNVNGDYTVPNKDFCDSSTQEKVLAAMSDGLGNTRIFEYQDDSEVTANAKYQINIGSTLQPSKPLATATYASNTSPIYLIEERVYTLDNQGNLKLARDGGTPETLIKRMDKFKVSARVYGDKKTKEPDTINAASPAVAPNLLPLSRRCDSTIPYYICEFNTTTADDWKTLQGVKVELKAKYDGTGQSATPSITDDEKRSASAEFFPRNVLSK